MSDLIKYYHTLKYLKMRQLLWRPYYHLRRKARCFGAKNIAATFPSRPQDLRLLPPILPGRAYDGISFSFLNQTLPINGKVDWDFSGFGKLWTYNLNYFDYLSQPDMDMASGLALIRDFIAETKPGTAGFEPYPTSLRIINWIKFICRYGINDRRIDAGLYAQAKMLSKDIEYHLLGNHLLENGFALLFAAFYCLDRSLYRKAVKILFSELEEQILPDGGHFELSPMYHQIILERVLDSINLIQTNPAVLARLDAGGAVKMLAGVLAEKAAIMLGWLRGVAFADGNIPLVNDAAEEIAPHSNDLLAYAARLGITEKIRPLKESGYRKIRGRCYEALLDVGHIGPDYIPGHAHADTFNFVLNIGDIPIIVDSGISTYEKNALRQAQRSTRAHNTVEIDGQDQSEVWGGFRVARRAKVIRLQETDTRISAMHNGYRRLTGKPLHQRTWVFDDTAMVVRDQLTGTFGEAVARFHFHPDVRVQPHPGSESRGILVVPGAANLDWTILKGRGRWIETTCHSRFNTGRSNLCLEIRFQEPTAAIRFTCRETGENS